MEQRSLIGAGFEKGPTGQFRQGILIDGIFSTIKANPGFRERHHSMRALLDTKRLHGLRVDIVDARKGLLTCTLMGLNADPVRDRSLDMDWLSWGSLLGLPTTPDNYQHNLSVTIQPVIGAADLTGREYNSGTQSDRIRYGLNPLVRYGYLGRYEDFDILTAARGTALQVVDYQQFWM